MSGVGSAINIRMAVSSSGVKSGLRQVNKELNAFARVAKRAIDSARTPAQKYGVTMSKLTAALSRGAIVQAQFNEQQKLAKQRYTISTAALNAKTAAVTRAAAATNIATVAVVKQTIAMRAGAAATAYMAGSMTMLMGSLGMMLGPLALVGGAWKTMTLSEDIKKAMNSALAIVENTSDAMVAKMKRAAVDMAKHTRFTIAEANRAYYYLLSSGLSPEQAVLTLPKVGQFAMAGDFDLQRATELATGVQAAFGLGSKDAVKHMENLVMVTDSLIRANVLVQGSAEQFAEAMGNTAATTAKLSGQTLPEVIGMLALFAKKMIKGREAGQAYTIMLKNLEIKSQSNAAAFKKYNIDVFDKVTGKWRLMTEVAKDLDAALMVLTPRARIIALMELGFTQKSIQTMKIILGEAEELKRMVDYIAARQGDTARVAGKQMTELEKGWKQLWTTIQDLTASGVGPWLDDVGRGLQALSMGVDDAKNSLVTFENVWSGLRALDTLAGLLALGHGGIPSGHVPTVTPHKEPPGRWLPDMGRVQVPTTMEDNIKGIGDSAGLAAAKIDDMFGSYENMMKASSKVVDSFQTPLEKYNKTAAKLYAMFDAGLFGGGAKGAAVLKHAINQALVERFTGVERLRKAGLSPQEAMAESMRRAADQAKLRAPFDKIRKDTAMADRLRLAARDPLEVFADAVKKIRSLDLAGDVVDHAIAAEREKAVKAFKADFDPVKSKADLGSAKQVGSQEFVNAVLQHRFGQVDPALQEEKKQTKKLEEIKTKLDALIEEAKPDELVEVQPQ